MLSSFRFAARAAVPALFAFVFHCSLVEVCLAAEPGSAAVDTKRLLNADAEPGQWM